MSRHGDIFLLLTLALPALAALPANAALPADAKGPLSIHPAQPHLFLEASGRRALLMGTEDGAIEAWLQPIKVFRDLRLSVYIDDALEPSPLAQLTRTAEVAASHSTLVHSHPAFTVRQTWVASPDEPAAAILLDIDTSRPLRFRLALVPEMKPMWPASFGGQATGWDEKAGVLAFGEGLRRFRPVVGSPAFRRISEQIGHQMPDRTILIEFDVQKSGRVPILLAGSRALYDKLIANPAALLDASKARFDAFLQRTASLKMQGISEPFDWAKLAIERGWSCPEGVGCGLVAGWALSGLSERPGFGWFFGGDTMMSAWAMSAYGDFEGARTALEFLIARQRADGKIMHEWTQSSALLDWSKYPYGFYHADTTPLFLFSAAQYLRHSGDRDFLEKHWNVLNKAYEFCLSIQDPDGLLSNEKGGAAAVETGALSGKVKRDVYLQGVWLAGLSSFSDLAAWHGNETLRASSQKELARARQAISKWFVEDKGLFAFAELNDGTRYEANSGWQAMLTAFGGIDPAQARRAASALAKPTLATPWGTRLFATDSPFYNPLGYNDGSVWPFVTAQATIALFRHGQPEAAWRYLYGMAHSTGLSGAGFLAEYFSGDRFAEGPRAVPHQLFSSVALAWPALQGALGLEPDAFSSTLKLNPQIPCSAGPVRLENYRLGPSRLNIEITPEKGANRVKITTSGPPVHMMNSDAGCLDLIPPPALHPGQRATLP